MRAILLDLDGVLYVGDEAVPGAADAIAWLRRHEVPHVFVTNTSSRPRAAIAAKLAGFGIEATVDQILTPATAAAAWLRDSPTGRPALFVPEETAAEFADLDPMPADAEDGAGCVVVGDLGRGWDFETLNRAFRLLMTEPRPALVALGMTRYWRAADGLRLDAGAFVHALEYASGATAVVMGKPDPGFYDLAVRRVGVPKSEVVMLGDDIRADVDGAQQAGLAGVLVRTGKYTDADLQSGVVPHATLESIADLPDWWPGPC
ncbi:HAD superfamily hydrolase (TIGR01458 family) [Kribbella sp. VKM Ac-2527]|uniref:Haloacid dehalogenase-like hydrolase domain-containing protein 2 n=1 Tax=Kribbella caucasensis TaxID=2512215 RepID=A0A4R6KAD9_9ACTN|nr:TIGR01458 family HAD-type hydrolase [Kribbella sp. VKM Ac-2527]TDO46765.1 HAD superfamily hydrolase (TIGR01458 family) [Kribbella sp. VKM Ac-2527]